SVRDAANFLGIHRLRALVLSTSLIGQCDASSCQAFAADAFESYGLPITSWGEPIAGAQTHDRRGGEPAFYRRPLPPLELPLFASNFPQTYDGVLRSAAAHKVSVTQIERKAYGVTHAELAGFVRASWHIPFPIVNAVGFHAEPSLSDEAGFCPLTAVHLATS